MKKRFWSIVFVLAVCGCAALACLALAGADVVDLTYYQNFTKVKPEITYTEISRNSADEDAFVLKVNLGGTYGPQKPDVNVMITNPSGNKYSHDTIDGTNTVFDSQTNITTVKGKISYNENAVGSIPKIGDGVSVYTDAVLIVDENKKYYSQMSSAYNTTIVRDQGNSTVSVIVPDWVLAEITGCKPQLQHALIQRQSNGNDFFSLAVTAGNITEYVNCWEALLYTQDPGVTGVSNVTINGQTYQEIAIMTVQHDSQNMDATGVEKVTGDWYYYNNSCIPKAGTVVYVGAQAEIQNKYSKISNLIALKMPETGEISESSNSTVAVGGDLSEAVITLDLDNNTATYTGKAIEPGVTVELNGAKLTQGTDYTVEYKDNINVGTAKVLAIGKGSYTGTAQTNFTIVEEGKTDISQAVITLENTTMVYTGKAQEPAVVSVVLDGKTLNPSSDYSVSYENNVNAGTGAAVVKGKGAFTGSGKKEFEIKKAKNKITISPTKKTLKYAKLQKKNQKVKLTIKVLGKAGKTVVIKSVPKKVKKYFSINSASGKITVKKGIPKGTYKLKIQVTTAETANYLKTTKVQVIRITIK